MPMRRTARPSLRGSEVAVRIHCLSNRPAVARDDPCSSLSTEADVLVGPSSGCRWAEDGAYTLTAVRPAQAGQDIGLAGIVWLAPIGGGAFTRYALAGS